MTLVARDFRLARTGAAVLLTCTLAVAACESNSNTKKSDAGSSRSAIQGDDDAGSEPSYPDPCLDQKMGTPCAKDKYCIAHMCVFNTCGDGVKADGEECDDGNVAIGDGCDADCKAESSGGCGNAMVDGKEECDDGNRIDEDACSNMCTKNECGNLRLDGEEECDDGNTVDDDKCSNHCLFVRCRNGRVDPGEQCDDGNQIDNDGCTNKCRVMICGNGKIEEKEECDDGNMVDDDKCSNQCTENKCGNLRVDPGEQCDGTAHCDLARCVQVEDKCTPCEKMYCTNYMGSGLDLVAGCRQGDVTSGIEGAGIDPKSFPPPAEVSQICTAVVDCAQRNMCAASLDALAHAECYCGTGITPTDCMNKGPNAATAKCIPEIQTACGTTDNASILLRVSDFAYVMGWANYLLECEATYCMSECLGTP